MARRARLAPEADLLRQFLTLGRVVRRDHRIFRLQAPLRAIILGRHAVGGHQVPFQHLQLLAVFETDDVVVRHRLLDRNRGRQLDRRRLLATGQFGELGKDGLDQFWDVVLDDRVVRHMGGHDLRRQGKDLSATDDLIFRHQRIPDSGTRSGARLPQVTWFLGLARWSTSVAPTKP